MKRGDEQPKKTGDTLHLRVFLNDVANRIGYGARFGYAFTFGQENFYSKLVAVSIGELPYF